MSYAKLLIIEDDEHQQYLFSKFLSHAGFEITTVGTPSEALWEEWTEYDGVILDIMLNHPMSGERILEIKIEELGERLPLVVVFSALPGSILTKIRTRINNSKVIYQTKSGKSNDLLRHLKDLAGAMC